MPHHFFKEVCNAFAACMYAEKWHENPSSMRNASGDGRHVLWRSKCHALLSLHHTYSTLQLRLSGHIRGPCCTAMCTRSGRIRRAIYAGDAPWQVAWLQAIADCAVTRQQQTQCYRPPSHVHEHSCLPSAFQHHCH